MKKRTDSKAREVDREVRQTGEWNGVGFVVIVIGAVIAVLLLILGSV